MIGFSLSPARKGRRWRAALLAPVLWATAAPAQVPGDYRLVAASRNEVWYVDAASIRFVGPVAGFDVLSVQDGFPLIGGQKPLFLTVHREVDCGAHTGRQTMLGAWDEAGQPIIARTTAGPFEPVVPDSLGSGAFDFVCHGALAADQTNVRGATPLQIARAAAAYFAARRSAPSR